MMIRKLTENDLADLSALHKQFWGEESSLEKMQTTFRRLDNNPNYIFLVADIDGRLAGSVMGIVCEDLYGDCRPFMVIEDVVVDAHHRRMGAGTALMKELEKEATRHKCAYIIFVSEIKRETAQKFYASLGYQPDTHIGYKKRMDR